MDKRFEKLITAAEKHKDLVVSAERHIWNNPETGYKEWKTHAYMVEKFEALGYELTMAGNIPGFVTDVDTGRPGPKIVIVGELDSLICADHPEADPETKAVHSCGHNCQCAALLGVAAALKEPGVLDDMWGSIRLMVVPSEELVEIEFREELRRQGIIKYFGGKLEFMRRGLLDGCDMAMVVHASTDPPGTFSLFKGYNGCMLKIMKYLGVADHAGARPFNGINALYAATQGLSAINAVRETLRDEDHIRIHPIITSGGAAVSAIPDLVTLESYVRGASIPAIIESNDKVNRALAGSALSLGARVQITDRNGYSPMFNDENMTDIARKAIDVFCPEGAFIDRTHVIKGSSGDMGDVCSIMPALHPYSGGSIGAGHGATYYVAHPEALCMNSVKFQLIFLQMVLENEAAEGKRIIAEAKVPYKSKEELFAEIDKINQDLDAVTYNDDGSALVRYRKA